MLPCLVLLSQTAATSIVVKNPLSIAREDVVEAWIPMTQAPVILLRGLDGKTVAAQILPFDAEATKGEKIAFIAKLPAKGVASYDVEPGMGATSDGKEFALAHDHTLENGRFKVTIDEAGDIASIYDKANRREALRSPVRLDLYQEGSSVNPSYAPVTGPAKVQVVARGPVRAAIEITRESSGSKFVQTVSLAGGGAGDRVEVRNRIEWNPSESAPNATFHRQAALRVAFHLTTPNRKAAYPSEAGTAAGGSNGPEENPVSFHGWMDLTSVDGEYGVGILSPNRGAADKPNDDTLRLALVNTLETDEDQNVNVYGIAPHAGDWRKGMLPSLSARLAQPIQAFLSEPLSRWAR